MDPIKEALTFDDVTLAPKYSSVLPSDVNTSVKISKNLIEKSPICRRHIERRLSPA